jgi:glutathione S-transferase
MLRPITWGVEASPFLLKLEAMLRFHQQPFRRLPEEGGLLENQRTFVRLERAKRGRRVLRFPQIDRSLDEYPSMPFFSEDGEGFHYDSSALGHWLDDRSAADQLPLFPAEPPLRFIAQLIDEAFDEYGLYMVHHMRWVGSATDTAMGERTAQELSNLVTPLMAPLIRKYIPRRQVRRCPYLFSVAPQGYEADVEPALVPPSRPGFPPTHDLLDESWSAYLAAMESLLAAQSWILGDRFSIADASAYGQLSMNLIDPSAERSLRQQAPLTRRWLREIRDGRHVGSRGRLYLSDAARPLLEIIMTTFAPLMAQNEEALRAAIEGGETLFNEAAFDLGRATYDGELLGHPFRSVAKTFQVRVWREIRESWHRLSEAERAELYEDLPGHALLQASPDGAVRRRRGEQAEGESDLD